MAPPNFWLVLEISGVFLYMLYLINNCHHHPFKPSIEGEVLDPGLTKIGQEQAQLIADVFEEQKINYLFSSPAKRAYEMADIISEHLGVSIEINTLLFDQNPQNHEKLSEREFNYKQNLIPTPNQQLDVIENVSEFIQEINGKNTPAIITTHDIVIRMFLVNFLRMQTSRAWKLKFDQGSITTIDFQNKRLVTLNETSHLIE